MATYYVSTTGSDSADGSAASPFRSINQALSSGLKPGDEVVVRSGTYNENVNITTGGSAAADITLRSEVPGGAVIQPSGGWNAISVNANYVTINGFEIVGANGDGIEANNVHHISVLNNTVHGSGESGIQFNWSEFIRIEGNTTYGNATDGWFSGISIYQNRNITGDTTTEGFRTIVRNNISYDNVTETGQHTDGNGIIIDDFQSTQTGGYPSYTYPTLVENNLVYENGGKGIQVTWSDYVTVRNNTAYHNNQDDLNSGTWRGEISNSQSSNNTFVNNIMVADPSVNANNTAIDNTSYGGYSNDNVVWANNLTFNGTDGKASVRTDGGNAMPAARDGNLLGVNPDFVDPSSGDFHLRANSDAVDTGSSLYGLADSDLDGNDRTLGTVDLGAYEQGSNAAQNVPGGISEPSVIGETGTVSVAQRGGGQWHEVTFAEALDNPSVVISSMSANGPSPYTLRVRNVSDTGFEFQLDEWDHLDGKHVKETISWMAVESGTHTLADGTTISAGSLMADEQAVSVSFDTDAFGDSPVVLSQATSYRNKTALTDRIDNVDKDGFTVSLVTQEANKGTDLKNEALDWIAIEQGSGDLLADVTGATVTHQDTEIDLGIGRTADSFVFLADMQTRNGADPATVEVSSIENGIATMRIAEETSANAEVWHVAENVGYFGVDAGQIFGFDATSDVPLI
ncbi:MAG: nitrous oxide reductase family maturation protein NosD [Pseudodonghicola sp.]